MVVKAIFLLRIIEKVIVKEQGSKIQEHRAIRNWKRGAMTPPGSKPSATVTIRDVAKECGLSATTVSMVLSHAPLASNIPEATQKRIVRTAEGLGYQPNPFAQALRSRHSHTIGVMVPDIADPYCAQILRGIENSFLRSS